MDSYFPKLRRPISRPIKRAASPTKTTTKSIDSLERPEPDKTDHKETSPPHTPIKSKPQIAGSSIKTPEPSTPKTKTVVAQPKTPEGARLNRPQLPPPVKKCRPTSARELFKKIRPLELSSPPTPTKKISEGPLKGLSTHLLDLVRAKEAAAKALSPEKVRERQLLGIAPEIVRVTFTTFTANKRDIVPYSKVVDKCYRGLKSDYTSETIIECLNLIDKIAPEWASVVTISKGKFIRLNKNNYSHTQLLEAIKTYKNKNC